MRWNTRAAKQFDESQAKREHTRRTCLRGAIYDRVPTEFRRGTQRFRERRDPFQPSPQMFCAVHRLIKHEILVAESLDFCSTKTHRLQTRHYLLRCEPEHKAARRKLPVKIQDGEPIVAHEWQLAVKCEMGVQLSGRQLRVHLITAHFEQRRGAIEVVAMNQ